jgi:hypothetical protein
MSSLFNTFFTSIGITLANAIKQKCTQSQSPGNPPPGVNSTFKFQEIQVTSVLKNLSKLKTNKSTGLDHITARLLKDAAAAIALSLTQIFNLSLSSSTFPKSGKTVESQLSLNLGSAQTCEITDLLQYCQPYVIFWNVTFTHKSTTI